MEKMRDFWFKCLKIIKFFGKIMQKLLENRDSFIKQNKDFYERTQSLEISAKILIFVFFGVFIYGLLEVILIMNYYLNDLKMSFNDSLSELFFPIKIISILRFFSILSPILFLIIINEIISRKRYDFWYQWKKTIVFMAGLFGLVIAYLTFKHLPDYIMSTQVNPIDFKENFLIDIVTKIQEGIYFKNSKIELKETLLVALISAPVAFVIWSYRDKNEHDKINNERHDTNLKYFDQIQERLKYIQPLKFGDQNAAVEPTDEKTKYPETHLKIAAILQLADFIQGRYGENLRRPAFQLLRSLWESYVRPSYDLLEMDNIEEQREKYKECLANYDSFEMYNRQQGYKYLDCLQNDSLLRSMNIALIKGLTPLGSELLYEKNKNRIQKEAHFRDFKYDCHALFLVGFRSDLLPDTKIIFSDMNIHQANFSFCYFNNVEFKRLNIFTCNLSFSKIEKSNFFINNSCEISIDLGGLSIGNSKFISENKSIIKIINLSNKIYCNENDVVYLHEKNVYDYGVLISNSYLENLFIEIEEDYKYTYENKKALYKNDVKYIKYFRFIPIHLHGNMFYKTNIKTSSKLSFVGVNVFYESFLYIKQDDNFDGDNEVRYSLFFNHHESFPYIANYFINSSLNLNKIKKSHEFIYEYNFKKQIKYFFKNKFIFESYEKYQKNLYLTEYLRIEMKKLEIQGIIQKIP